MGFSGGQAPEGPPGARVEKRGNEGLFWLARAVAAVDRKWYGRAMERSAEGGTAPNTGLPASFAALPPPNPWSVTPFAKGGKRRASPAGSATRSRYAQLLKPCIFMLCPHCLR